jgi:hypothetical protein
MNDHVAEDNRRPPPDHPFVETTTVTAGHRRARLDAAEPPYPASAARAAQAAPGVGTVRRARSTAEPMPVQAWPALRP